MKVEIKPITGPECVSLWHIGNTMVIEPIFWRPNTTAMAGTITVKDANGKVCFIGILRVSRKTGRASLVTTKKLTHPVAVDGASKNRK